MKNTCTTFPFTMLFLGYYLICFNLYAQPSTGAFYKTQPFLKFGDSFFENAISTKEGAQQKSYRNFTYVHPNSSEQNKGLYSQNIALVLFASSTRGNTQAISFKKTKEAPYAPTYMPNSSTNWYIGDRLFAVDNSAFFGIKFDTSFAYKNGVIRIGDSSEKAFVILVSLN